MRVQADLVTAHSLLNDAKPDGLSIETASATKAFGLTVNLNITVDLTTITAQLVSSWILSRAIIKSMNVYVNGKRLPPEQAEASKMIIDAIHEEKEEKKGASE
jgi:hypothetical protein